VAGYCFAHQGACGEIKYGDGSRVRLDLKGESLNQSPDPQKELKGY
jgi:hypothetical protein